jgi:hypothetical protein
MICEYFNGKSSGMVCPWPNLGYCLAICLEGLRKITKIIIINYQCPSRNSKPSLEFKSETLLHEPTPFDIFKQSFRLTFQKSGTFHPAAKRDVTPRKTWILKNKDCTDIGIKPNKWLRNLVDVYRSVWGQKVTYIGIWNIPAVLLRKYSFCSIIRVILIISNFFHSHKS